MKAMILAAGYGTRLRPLTDQVPKALVEINGVPLLQLIILKLVATGVREIIINTHHFHDQIQAFVDRHHRFGIRIELSYEPEILGTGGGLAQARYFFDDSQPFILHNVDILSTIDLNHMVQFHLDQEASATLAIQNRRTSRCFIVDENHHICGHEDKDNQRTRLMRTPRGVSQLMAFCGIHVISPRIFEFIEKQGRFSIIDVYLKMIEANVLVIGYPADQFYWQDIGKLNTLHEVQRDLASGRLQIQQLLR